MSKPTAPYYYKDDANVAEAYHWETSCSKNHYPDAGWTRSWTKPNKEECNECKTK